MSRLRVVHVITGLTLGGAERYVESVVRHTRHDARVVSLYRDGPVGDALRADGFQARSLDLDPARKPAAILALAGLLRRDRPDVVNVHLLSGQGVGIPAARLARVPLVVSTEHSIMDDEAEGRPVTRRLRLAYRAVERLTSHTLAVSATTADRLQRWGVDAARVSVVGIGIEFDRLAFDPAGRSRVRAELGVPEGARIVLAVGRLDPVKRLDVLVRALADRLRHRGDHLVLVGEGPLRPELTTLAAAYGVADRVHLLGGRTDMAAVLSAGDVLVSPSLDETFGMAVVEALGNGLPVAFAQSPALDDLALTDPRVRRLPRTADPRQAERAVADAVDDLLAAGPAARVAPARLLDAYDVRRRVRDLDDLYLRLQPSPDAERLVTC